MLKLIRRWWAPRRVRRGRVARPLALEQLAGRILPTATWTNPGGGAWDDPNNWVDLLGMHHPPGPGEEAVIPYSGIGISQNTFDRFFSVGSINLTGGAVTLGVNLDVAGSITSAGALALTGGRGPVSGAGTGGSITTMGTLTLATVTTVSGTVSASLVDIAFTNVGRLQAGSLLTPVVRLEGGTLYGTMVPPNTTVVATASGGTLQNLTVAAGAGVDLRAPGAELTLGRVILNGNLTMGNNGLTNANTLTLLTDLTGTGNIQMGTTSVNTIEAPGFGGPITIAGPAIQGSGRFTTDDIRYGQFIIQTPVTANAAGGT